MFFVGHYFLIFVLLYFDIMDDVDGSMKHEKNNDATVPTAPPSDVRGESLDSRSIRVEWKPPPVEKHNGLITKYVLKYQKVPDRLFVKNSTLLNSTSLHHQQVIQALMKTRYQSPVNSLVNTVDAKDSDSDDEGNETESSQFQEQTVDASQRSFIIKNLQEWTSYRISVTAATKIGLGPQSPQLIIRTDESGMSNAFLLTFCSTF